MSEQAAQRAGLLQESGRHVEAVRYLGEALAADPDDRRLLALLAVSLEALDRHEELLAVSRRLIELHPQNAGGYLFASSAHHSLEQHELAVAAAGRAVQLSPDNPGSHRMYAWTSSALVWRQTSGTWRGIVAHERGGPALQAAHRAVELGPDDADNHACLGTIAMRHGRRRLARDAFGHALRLDPGHGLAHHNLGVLDRAGLRLGSAADHLVTSAAAPGAAGRATSVRNLVTWWAGVTSGLSLWLWQVLTVRVSIQTAFSRGVTVLILAVLLAWVVVPAVRITGPTRRAIRRLVGASRLMTTWLVTQVTGWTLAALTRTTVLPWGRTAVPEAATAALVLALLLVLGRVVQGWFIPRRERRARG